MWESHEERSAFQRLERELSAEDKALSAFLSGRCRRRRPAAVTGAVYLTPVILAATGLLARSAVLLGVAILAIPLVPLLATRLLTGPFVGSGGTDASTSRQAGKG
jgi:hypothetical protein